MRVVVAGSHDAEPPIYALHLLQQLAQLPLDAIVLLRGPLEGHAGPIELLAEQLARDLSIGIEWCLPEPGTGREGTFLRDIDMVDRSDLVIAYFHPNRIMEGGTGHVIDYALHQEGKQVEAYAPVDGELTWVGSSEVVIGSASHDDSHRAAS